MIESIERRYIRCMRRVCHKLHTDQSKRGLKYPGAFGIDEKVHMTFINISCDFR